VLSDGDIPVSVYVEAQADPSPELGVQDATRREAARSGRDRAGERLLEPSCVAPANSRFRTVGGGQEGELRQQRVAGGELHADVDARST